VDRHSGKFSGGENQSPYFIAILASYLRAYKRYATRKVEPSLGLVPIDEAFSKLSGERVKDCVTALKAFELQGVFFDEHRKYSLRLRALRLARGGFQRGTPCRQTH
jgi:uncharacterized protein YPO0396